MKNKKTAAVLLALTLSFSAVGCGAASSGNTAVAAALQNAVSTQSQAVTLSGSELFTERDLSGATDEIVTVTLSGSSATADGAGVEVSDGLVTITQAGSYLLTGSFTGQIRVTAGEEDKVQLILSSFSKRMPSVQASILLNRVNSPR